MILDVSEEILSGLVTSEDKDNSKSDVVNTKDSVESGKYWRAIST